MEKSKLFFGSVMGFALANFVAVASVHAGGGSTGGGQAVRIGSKVILLDDYHATDKDICANPTRINVFQNPLTKASAEKVDQKIDSVSADYPDMAKRLKLEFHAMDWELCPTSLPLLNDSAYKDVIAGELEQAAIQREGGEVFLSEPEIQAAIATADPSDPDFVESLLAHELLLDYLGFSVDRDILREANRALRNSDESNLAAAIANQSEDLLHGQIRIEFEFNGSIFEQIALLQKCDGAEVGTISADGHLAVATFPFDYIKKDRHGNIKKESQLDRGFYCISKFTVEFLPHSISSWSVKVNGQIAKTGYVNPKYIDHGGFGSNTAGVRFWVP